MYLLHHCWCHDKRQTSNKVKLYRVNQIGMGILFILNYPTKKLAKNVIPALPHLNDFDNTKTDNYMKLLLSSNRKTKFQLPKQTNK